MTNLKEYREPCGDRETTRLAFIKRVGTKHLCCTSGTSRFEIDLTVADIGHTLIGAPTGTGMTTVASIITRREPDFIAVLRQHALFSPRKVDPQ